MGDDGHETFILPTVLPGDEEIWSFCKTARKPYDVVVTAILSALEHYAPWCITTASDGNESDWQAGVDLARTILDDPTIQCPPAVRN